MRFISARQVVSEAYCRSIKIIAPFGLVGGGKSDNGWSICDGLEKGKVRAVVDGLPPQQRLWLLYAYTENYVCDATAESVIIEWLLWELDASPPMAVTGYQDVLKIPHLLLLLVHEARALERSGQQMFYDSELARRVFGNDEQRSNFKKHLPWGRLADTVRRLLNGLNSSALGPVADLVYREAEKQRGVA